MSAEAKWAVGPAPISVFMYACIMLNTTKHSEKVRQSDKDRQTAKAFIRQLAGTNTNDTKVKGTDPPEDKCIRAFNSIVTNEVKVRPGARASP